MRSPVKKEHSQRSCIFCGLRGGVQLDLNLFARKNKPGDYIIDIGKNHVRGGRLKYINTKNIKPEMHTDPNDPQTGKGEPLNLQFINIQTQVIHEHQVAELYYSPLRMLDIKIGMLFRL